MGGESHNVVPFLPRDIIFEILSWLPAITLLRWKSVCKEWYHLIQDRRFILKHRSRCKMVSCETEVASLNADGKIIEKFKMIDKFAGLIVEKGDSSQKYRIRNPTIHQILYLPDPHEGTFRMTICYDVSTGDFKMVSAYHDKATEFLQGFEAFSFDRDDEWRPLKLPSVLQERLKERRRFEFRKTGETLHFFEGNDTRSNVYLEVHTLDIGSECFFSNTLSRCTFSDSSKVWFLNWNGGMAFADIAEEMLNVVVLEDHKKHKWSEKKIIGPLTFLRENQDIKNPVPFAFHLGKYLFYSKGEKIFAYDARLRRITLMGSFDWYRLMPSLLTFKGMQAEKIGMEAEKIQPEMNL